MIIRNASAEDAKNLSALAIQVWLHTHARQGVNNSIARYVFSELSEVAFLRLMDDPNVRVLAAYRDRFLVAYAVLHLDAPCPDAPMIQSEVTSFYVQEHCGRQGVGAALLAECVKSSSNDNGKAALWMAVNAQNSSMTAFCRKQNMLLLGFSNVTLGTERHENYILACGEL